MLGAAMAAPSRPWSRAVAALGLAAFVGCAAYFVTRSVLGLWRPLGPELPPVVFDELVENEPDPFKADLHAAAQVIRQRFAYLEHRRTLDGLDLDALEAAALAELAADPSEEGFQRALTGLVAGLHDGHAFAKAAEYRLPGPRRWPLTLTPVAEGLMVDGVHEEAAALVFRGEFVTAVDGVPVEQLVAQRSRYVFGSSALARRQLAIEHLARWTSAEEVTLTLRDPGGAEREVRVACPPSHAAVPQLHALPTGREARLLEPDIAYFRPGNFSPPADSGWSSAPPQDRDSILADSYRALADAIESFGGVRALVLDLRGNPGGTDLLGQALARHLLGTSAVYYGLASLGASGWREPIERDLSGSPEPALRCRLICLIDEGTFSVADNLAACMRDEHPDVTFVGRPTGAGTGAPRPFQLPRTGATIVFCTMRVYSPSGTLIEGSGVTPDVPVQWTRADVLAGADPDLAAALALLAR